MTKHGKHKSRPYMAWKNMLQRCTNENHPHYHCYGGRGITICDRWQDFENFYADMGDPPKGKTLERIDNEAGYYPENCCWASMKAQGRNRRTTTFIEYDGREMSRPEWAEELGVSCDAIRTRQRLGWPVEKILSTPFDGNTYRYIKFNGEEKKLSEWADSAGISRRTFAQRLDLGWPVEKALTQRPGPQGRRNAQCTAG